MNIPISNGDLLDKMSVLKIKLDKITDEKKNKNILNEYILLKPYGDELCNNIEIANLFHELIRVNLVLWNIEDKIRECEKNKIFNDQFIQLARAVYFNNDKRSLIKKEINEKTKSEIIEEKSYTQYEEG